MFVIRLQNGNLLAPESAVEARSETMGDALIEIGPADPEYSRLAARALSEAEVAQRKRRWQEGDAALRGEFERFLAGLRDADG